VDNSGASTVDNLAGSPKVVDNPVDDDRPDASGWTRVDSVALTAIRRLGSAATPTRRAAGVPAYESSLTGAGPTVRRSRRASLGPLSEADLFRGYGIEDE
jgi:hypothetical protein